MKAIEIRENEAGQRLDRFLLKYMNKASKGFIEKMIRKKRIKVNKGKAEPNYSLQVGDEIQLYLAEETIGKFTEKKSIDEVSKNINILYEDERILVLNKSTNTLTHGEGNSLVNRAITYLIHSASYYPRDEKTFIPASCNRLDRNTSGIVIIGKTYDGLKEINQKIKDNQVSKYYLTLVKDVVTKAQTLEGYWTKVGNQVKITRVPANGEAKEVITKIEPIDSNGKVSLLQVELVTGRTHQIRAHLKSISHPIIGDPKYGDAKWNKEYELSNQFLHAYKIVISDYNEKESLTITAPLPKKLQEILKRQSLDPRL